MNKGQFKESLQQFKRKLKNPCGQHMDNDLPGVAGDYDSFQGFVQELYVDQKEEIARWAEDWCERGGWRNHPPSHRD